MNVESYRLPALTNQEAVNLELNRNRADVSRLQKMSSGVDFAWIRF